MTESVRRMKEMTDSVKPPSAWTHEEIMGTRHSAVKLLEEAIHLLGEVEDFVPSLHVSDPKHRLEDPFSEFYLTLKPYNFHEKFVDLNNRHKNAFRARCFTVEVRLLKKLAKEGPLESLAVPKFGPMGSFEALEDKGLATSFPGELLPDTLTWDITEKGLELLVLLKEEEKNDG
jgi:hypothetical protein